MPNPNDAVTDTFQPSLTGVMLGSNTELRSLGEQESRSIHITPHGFWTLVRG
jgi:hypothetical protein